MMRQFPSRLGWSLFLLAVAGCASPGGRAPDSVVGPAIRFAYVGNRQLEMEVCGCTLAQLGGVDREANVLASMTKEPLAGLFLLSGGRTFLPKAGIKLPPRHLTLKREMLVDALNELNLLALGISAGDTQIGLQELQKLAARAKFPFLATNLSRPDHSPVFQRSLSKVVNNKKVLFLSLTQITHALELPPGLTLEAPVQAVAAEIARQNPPPDWIVVLSDLSVDTARQLATRFPNIRLVLGTDALDPGGEDYGFLLTSRALLTDSLGFGRGMAWVDLEGEKGSLFNQSGAQAINDYRQILQGRRDQWKKQKSKLGASLREQLRETELTLSQLPTIPSTDAEGLLRYKASTIRLGPDWSKPTNSLTKRQELLRAALRELALNTD